MESNMPPRWGFLRLAVNSYKYDAPTELARGASAWPEKILNSIQCYSSSSLRWQSLKSQNPPTTIIHPAS